MAPPQGRMHPSRYLIVLAAIFVVLYALVFFTGPGTLSHWQGKLKPKLGLDLVGGTTLTLIASEPGGKTPSAANLEEARQIIENRVNGLGVSEPQVVTQGNNQIVVSVASDGRVYVGEKQAGEGDMVALMRKALSGKSHEVHVKADRKVEYGKVRVVLERLHEAGAAQVALGTNERKEPK